MAHYEFSTAALLSLEEAGIYTEQQWGKTQRKKYIDAIYERCEYLAQSPLMGRSREPMDRGLRSYQEGHHIIFYISNNDEDGIFIVDVLHEKMEPARHLKPQA